VALLLEDYEQLGFIFTLVGSHSYQKNHDFTTHLAGATKVLVFVLLPYAYAKELQG